MTQDELNLKLWMAAFSNDADGAREAIKNGADVNDKNKSTGWTPLHFAAYRGHIETIKVLIENGSPIRVDIVDLLVNGMRLK